MEDLISREACIKDICAYCNDQFPEEPCEPADCLLLKGLVKQRAIDAVPVVRCGECIHSSRSPFGHPVLRWCPLRDSHRSPDWFCADGKKEEK